MLSRDFYYDLPPGLIAQYPADRRSDSRLLVLEGESGTIQDQRFPDLAGLLRSGDLLVFNDTRVIPARLKGAKATGGQVEVLIERILDSRHALAQVRASKSPRSGSRLHLAGSLVGEVTGRRGSFFELYFPEVESLVATLEDVGEVPLPPYIERIPDAADRGRYQTVFARRPGAVAAPTAGLHFDQPFIETLERQGIATAYVTLHVGAGTFQPMRVENILEHRMHPEFVEVSPETCDAIAGARARGGRVVAVGTTVVRSLESAVVNGEVKPFSGETDMFIYPGHRFTTIDALVTNFHLPESTLLMLVCAFGGFQSVMNAYRHAVEQHYRFFSYGDAMFVLPARDALPRTTAEPANAV
jgi:S-adenosylmethionine:tRNA ribosyltransferase-isomerase